MNKKLYKFRSLERALDVLENGFRFSSFDSLNDPMEGLFFYYDNNKIIDDLVKQKKKLGICSFSENYENPLMWTFYADEGKGVCLEIKKAVIEEYNNKHSMNKIFLDKINYTNKIKLFRNHNNIDINEEAKNLIFQKLQSWENENEWRGIINISNLNKNFENVRLDVSSIFLGYRISNIKKYDLFDNDFISALKNILKFCLKNNIKVYKTDYSEITTTENFVELKGNIEKSKFPLREVEIKHIINHD